MSRKKIPRELHATWNPPSTRPDPVHLVQESDKGRIPELVPLRHGRMALSAFTFYRGAALNMAEDLASMPSTGVRVQCCGDAHWSTSAVLPHLLPHPNATSSSRSTISTGPSRPPESGI